MITTDKVIEIFCVLDDFCKNLDTELTKNLHIAPWTRDISEWETAKGKCPKAKSWPSCCATILAHSATSSTITSFSSRNIWQATSSMPCPTRVSWNSCPAYFSTWCPSCASKVLESAWAFVSSTSSMPQHEKEIQQGAWWTYQERKGNDGLVPWSQAASAVQRDGRRTHVLPNSRKRRRQKPRVWKVFAKVLYGKVFAGKGYIKQEFFGNLFNQGIHLVHRLKSNMKNNLMPLWDKMMLRKRYIIECINELLKNKAYLVHSRHRSVHNFLMNLCAALAAYCFFENKPEALPVRIEKSRQLELF